MRWRHFAGLSHHLALPGRVRHQCARTHTHTHTHTHTLGDKGENKQKSVTIENVTHTHTVRWFWKFI